MKNNISILAALALLSSIALVSANATTVNDKPYNPFNHQKNNISSIHTKDIHGKFIGVAIAGAAIELNDQFADEGSAAFSDTKTYVKVIGALL